MLLGNKALESALGEAVFEFVFLLGKYESPSVARGNQTNIGTMAKDTARSHGILAIYHKQPKVPYCFYKLVTNVIRAVQIHVLSYPWFVV